MTSIEDLLSLSSTPVSSGSTGTNTTTQAIIKDSVVTNIVVVDIDNPPTAFEGETYVTITSPDVGVGWTWNGTAFVAPTITAPTDEQIKFENKERAKELLSESDWTATSDVQNQLTTESAAAWITYRTMLRTYLGDGLTEQITYDVPVTEWKS
jgi:hypothetical protein